LIGERINADFSQRVVLATAAMPWIASPQPGVQRRPLDRVGGEVARATSIVRYAPDSRFPAHEHGLGEEFLVLEGVFSDEHGDYPAGTYVRNPPGTHHAPRTRPGCIILVKLRQMTAGERDRIVVDTGQARWQPGETAGHWRLPLYAGGGGGGGERVALERLDPRAQLPAATCRGGEEIYLLSGALSDEHGTYGAGTWIRNPDGYQRSLRSATGATWWVKRGHLPPLAAGG